MFLFAESSCIVAEGSSERQPGLQLNVGMLARAMRFQHSLLVGWTQAPMWLGPGMNRKQCHIFATTDSKREFPTLPKTHGGREEISLRSPIVVTVCGTLI